MALVFGKTTSSREYNVKDLSQFDFGLGEIELAEVEMPGLMACRAEFGPSQPFKGAKITNSLHKMKDRLVGVSEETISGFKRLYQMQGGTLLFSAINVNDSVSKSNFDNLYDCRHSLPDGLMRARDVMISGKVAVVCGYGDVSKSCAAALKRAGARVIVEIDPICALQALMEGLQVLTLEDVVSVADIFVITTSNKDIIMGDHMRRMKNNAIVCNIGHFGNGIDILGLETYPGVKRVTIKPLTDRWVLAETNTGIIVLSEGRLMNLGCGCATGHPSFVVSCSFTNQVIGKRN